MRITNLEELHAAPEADVYVMYRWNHHFSEYQVRGVVKKHLAERCFVERATFPHHPDYVVAYVEAKPQPTDQEIYSLAEKYDAVIVCNGGDCASNCDEVVHFGRALLRGER